MDIFKKLFNTFKRNSLIKIQGNAVNFLDLNIPYPTKDLIFHTNENPENRVGGFGIKISIDLDHLKFDTAETPLSEPSLIWLQLPIEINNELEKEAMYWPNYFDFSPKHRYQYLKWLENIEEATNKSYAYLYYYGLERKMLLGNYDLAVKETLRLLKFHDIASYQGILMASILRNKFEIFNDHLEILTKRMDNASLFMYNGPRNLDS